MKTITTDRVERKIRKVRSKIKGTVDRLRISVFRSNRYIYAQVIDDVMKVTITQSSSLELKDHKKDSVRLKKTEDGKKVGIELAKKLLKKNIKKGVFDRGSYSYNGRVKALAEGLREGGIEI